MFRRAEQHAPAKAAPSLYTKCRLCLPPPNRRADLKVVDIVCTKRRSRQTVRGSNHTGRTFLGQKEGQVFLPDSPGYLLGMCASLPCASFRLTQYWALHQGKAHLSYE